MTVNARPGVAFIHQKPAGKFADLYPPFIDGQISQPPFPKPLGPSDSYRDLISDSFLLHKKMART